MLSKLVTLSRRFSPDLHKIVSNTSWLIADKILQMGLGLLVGVWLARYLGPNQFGIYNYAMSFVGMFTPIVNMGLNSIVVRDIACQPLQKNETLGTTFALSFIGGLITLVFSVGLITILEPSNNITQWLVGIIALGTLFQAFDTIDIWFQSQLQSKYVVLSRRTAYILISIVRVILIQVHAPLIAFGWARSIELILSAVGMAIVYRNRGNKIESWRFNLSIAKELLQESFPLIVSGLSIYAYSKIDQVMLGSLLEDKSQLGFYAAAVRITEIFDFLPVVIASSVLPKFSQLKKQGNAYVQKMQIYFDIMLILWVIVAIPISLFAHLIIHLIYGDFYLPSAMILSVYVWGQFACNLGVARTTFLTIESKLYYLIYINISGAVLNIILNLFLIPKLQAIGATIATLITYFVVAILINFLIKDLRPVAIMIVRSLNLYHSVLRIVKLLQ